MPAAQRATGPVIRASLYTEDMFGTMGSAQAGVKATHGVDIDTMRHPHNASSPRKEL